MLIIILILLRTVLAETDNGSNAFKWDFEAMVVIDILKLTGIDLCHF